MGEAGEHHMDPGTGQQRNRERGTSGGWSQRSGEGVPEREVSMRSRKSSINLHEAISTLY